jgi:hypothetical protein
MKASINKILILSTRISRHLIGILGTRRSIYGKSKNIMMKKTLEKTSKMINLLDKIHQIMIFSHLEYQNNQKEILLGKRGLL